MKVLHVAPGDSAGGGLKEAIRLAGHQLEVLSFNDDLSCGPIAWGTARERATWWSHLHAPIPEDDLAAFWHRLETTDERLVVWFGRHSASELAFFLALADRLGDRPYEIVDVTMCQAAGAVAVIPPTAWCHSLRTLARSRGRKRRMPDSCGSASGPRTRRFES
jgi:hypothetical protein